MRIHYLIWIIGGCLATTATGFITNWIGAVATFSFFMCLFFFSKMRSAPKRRCPHNKDEADETDDIPPTLFDIELSVGDIPDTLCVIPEKTERVVKELKGIR